jgi:hypothetical protein
MLQSKPTGFILVFSSLISLYFNPSLQDPFNSPKFWILILSGSWLAGFLLTKKNNIPTKLNSELKILNSLLVIFIFSMFISALFSHNKFIAFFGDSGRRLGFLTYLFLVIFMVVTYTCFNQNSLIKLYKTIFII